MIKTSIILSFALICLSCSGQEQTNSPKENIQPETNELIVSNAPANISRSITEDRNGHIWIAAFDGVFRYDRESFTNMIKDVSSARFFSILEDSKGNMWFGSIGEGVFRYDGKSFQNFTTNDGLVNNEVVSIYEDTKGNIWLGMNGGISVYNGESFQNFLTKGDTITEDKTGETVPNMQRPPHEINSIIEDKSGKFWIATRGNTFTFDGESFTTVNRDGIPFGNVRCLIEDKRGHIWLSGQEGLWRYDGSTFTKISGSFGGYVYEDKKGNIWTSGEDNIDGWALSHYDAKSLTNKKPVATIIKAGEKMIFGISEASDGSIWFGTLNGVHRYDGNSITHFKDSEGKE